MKKTIKKIKLIYSGELLLIALIFLVVGTLELFRIMVLSERAQLIFKIITLVGAAWIFTDFVWTLVSPKKRKKNSLMDKIVILPAGVYLVVFDIVGFVLPRPYEYYQIGIPIALYYIACVYIFEGFYHYYHPIPMVNEMIEEAINEAKEKEQPKEDIPLVEEEKIEDNNEEK